MQSFWTSIGHTCCSHLIINNWQIHVNYNCFFINFHKFVSIRIWLPVELGDGKLKCERIFVAESFLSRIYSDNPELRALSGNDRFSFPETFVRLLKSAQKTPDFVYLISAQDEKAIYSLSILIKVAASRVALTFD